MTESKKQAWDTAGGIDWRPYLTEWPPESGRTKVEPHEFPPLFKNTRLVAEYDMEGRGDGFQMAKKGDYLYFCHFFSSGFSVVDVKDPKNPKVVNFISTGNPQTWNIKCRVYGDILIVAEEWKFFVPSRYTVKAEEILRRTGQDRPLLADDPITEEENGPKDFAEAGIKIYDIKNPVEPELLSFFKVGRWTPEGGDLLCHRFSFDGHYAYLSASEPGYQGCILVIVDVSKPKEPREVSRWWMPGQWIAGGERPTWPHSGHYRCHYGMGLGDRIYGSWFGLGGLILDISNITRPTMISHFNFDYGGSGHTFMPIKNRQFAVFVDEFKHTYMLDIKDEKHPKVIDVFPRPPRELFSRGNFRGSMVTGPAIHNIHENYPGPNSFQSDDLIFGVCGAGGLRIYDVRDPYRVEEVGYFVPGTPRAQYDPRGPLFWGIDCEDLWVDNNRLIYLSDWNGGLRIVEFTG